MEELEVNGPEGHEREEEMSVWSGIILDARASGHASLGEGREARVHVGWSDFQPGWAGWVREEERWVGREEERWVGWVREEERCVGEGGREVGGGGRKRGGWGG